MWEGELSSKGGKVKIRVRPNVAVVDYPTGGDINYQDLNDNFIELLIDKAKLTAFIVDDIDAAQADIKIVNEATIEAGEQMKIAIDTEVLGGIYTGASSQVPVQAVTKANVVNWLMTAGTELDQLNIPSEGRWVVVPPWIAQMIKEAPGLADASASGDSVSSLRNGRVGTVDRFAIHVSNNLTTTVGGTQWECIAGTKTFASFASQYTKTETLRLQNRIGDAIRSLNVYGFGVTHPDSGVHMPATQ